MTQHRNVGWEPASPASEQNPTTRSLDELASDLRALAVQVTAARMMSLGTGAGHGNDSDIEGTLLNISH